MSPGKRVALPKSTTSVPAGILSEVPAAVILSSWIRMTAFGTTLPLFTSNMREARTAIIFGAGLCCAPTVVSRKHKARLIKTARLDDTNVAIRVPSKSCHPERSSCVAKRSSYAVEGPRAIKVHENASGNSHGGVWRSPRVNSPETTTDGTHDSRSFDCVGVASPRQLRSG